jgi:hypothetical protein
LEGEIERILKQETKVKIYLEDKEKIGRINSRDKIRKVD